MDLVPTLQFVNKTLDRADLADDRVAAWARRLQRLTLRFCLRGDKLAVNGVLRRRFRIRMHKLWEYSTGFAATQPTRGMRVLDFGGAATAPLFLLAEAGIDLTCIDIDRSLLAHTRDQAERRGFRIACADTDLTQVDATPTSLGRFDRILSFCVIEHIHADQQAGLLRRLSSLLAPAGFLFLSFDFGQDAPVEHAIRDEQRLHGLLSESGLRLMGTDTFRDNLQRHRLDKRYPRNRFTMGSVLLAPVTASGVSAP